MVSNNSTAYNFAIDDFANLLPLLFSCKFVRFDSPCSPLRGCLRHSVSLCSAVVKLLCSAPSLAPSPRDTPPRFPNYLTLQTSSKTYVIFVLTPAIRYQLSLNGNPSFWAQITRIFLWHIGKPGIWTDYNLV